MQYHTDAYCGVCQGPLEVDRDAICHTCAPPEEYFRHCAEMQDANEAWRGYCRRRRLFFLGVVAWLAALAITAATLLALWR